MRCKRQQLAPSWRHCPDSGRLSSWPRLLVSMRLAPGIALNPLGAVHADIDVAVVIDGYGLAPLSGASGLAFRERGRNEGGHRSVPGAADREPAPEAAIDSPSRFGIRA